MATHPVPTAPPAPATDGGRAAYEAELARLRTAELERLREFAAAVQAALLTPELTDLARLARITVAHAQLKAERQSGGPR